MIMYEQDPDVIRWGLHLLQAEFSTSYNGVTSIQSTTDIGNIESSATADCTTVESDEIIAQALQEEFSQVALEESRGTSFIVEKHLQASVLAQNWLGPAQKRLISENEGATPADAFELRNLFCSQTEEISEGQRSPLELTEDFSSLDGEVGKRLDKVVPVRHVPKINGEIPSVDEATSDHERLLERLVLYDLVELKVQGDGNCQFRSLSDQLYRTPEYHKLVRQQIVTQLKSHPDIYEGYVPMAFEEYLRKISKSGEWGDHVTLQAAADSYGVKIFVLTSFKDTCYIEIMPTAQRSKRVIFLSFWAEVHYNSIYPEGEIPVSETIKKKKSWWHFGHKH